jgi:hypothetical protein
VNALDLDTHTMAHGRAHRQRRSLLAAAMLAVLLVVTGWAPPAQAAEVYVRVLSPRARLRTGPAPSFRILYLAERGESFRVEERGPRGYWYRVALPNGILAWIAGEDVEPYEIVPAGQEGVFTRMGRAINKAIFAPSPLPGAHAEITLSAGAIDGSGSFLVRPAVYFAPIISFEAFVGESLSSTGSLLVYGGGPLINLLPNSPVIPFLTAAGGGASAFPRADAFALTAGTRGLLAIGGGLRFIFKKRITVRFDYRRYNIFDADTSIGLNEFSGGLAMIF